MLAPPPLNLKTDQEPSFPLHIFQHIRQILFPDCLFFRKIRRAVIDIRGIAAHRRIGQSPAACSALGLWFFSGNG